MYRDCIFDLYGTLVDISTDENKMSLWETLVLEFGDQLVTRNPVELKRLYQESLEEEEALMWIREAGKRGLVDKAGSPSSYQPEIRLEKVFGRLMPVPDGAENSRLVLGLGRRFRELSMEFIRPYPGVFAMLQTLRDQGRRVWLLSNAQRIFTAYELETLGLLPFFDGIYLSSDYGHRKPDPAFFRILLDEQKIDPHQAIMVGNDGNCDIVGAGGLGLDTLYIRSATSPPGDAPQADYHLDWPDMKRVEEILLSKTGQI